VVSSLERHWTCACDRSSLHCTTKNLVVTMLISTRTASGSPDLMFLNSYLQIFLNISLDFHHIFCSLYLEISTYFCAKLTYFSRKNVVLMYNHFDKSVEANIFNLFREFEGG
jgi:hypothetical protein